MDEILSTEDRKNNFKTTLYSLIKIEEHPIMLISDFHQLLKGADLIHDDSQFKDVLCIICSKTPIYVCIGCCLKGKYAFLCNNTSKFDEIAHKVFSENCIITHRVLDIKDNLLTIEMRKIFDLD
jgi:hypothetical protein